MLDLVYDSLRQSRLLEADRLLATLLLQRPRDPEVHRARAIAAQMAGRVDVAIEALRTAVDLDPASAALQMEFGQLLASNGHVVEGIETFRRVTVLQPALA